MVTVNDHDIDACSDLLFQLGARAIEEQPASAPERDVDLNRSADTARTTLVAGFESDTMALHARSLINERWPGRLEDTGSESQWRDAWLQHLKPITTAGFTISAPWHDVERASGHTPIIIDPGRAFGSGHHPTTRLCLQALVDQVKPTSRVLDVGCGTGVLSIAAAAQGAAAVVGLDLNHDVLTVAQANIEHNQVDHVVTVSDEPIGDDASGMQSDRFDIVVANIVIGDLRPLVPQLEQACESTLIMSGFYEHQLDSLLSNISFTLDDQASLDGWACAVLRR